LEKTGEDSFSTIDFATERIKTILTITRKIEFKLLEDCSLKFNETLILDAENIELALNQISCFVGLPGSGR
jgi:hypothetical protein